MISKLLNVFPSIGGTPQLVEDSELKAAIRRNLAKIIGPPGEGMLSQFTGMIESGLNLLDEDNCRKLAEAVIELSEELKPLIK